MSESNEDQKERDYAKEAAEDGWVPEDQWKGDKSKWVDAKSFVERGESFLPIVNARLRKERERTAHLEQTVEELKAGNKAFFTLHEQILAKEQKEKAQIIAQLEEVRKKAVTDGDGETFAAADKKIEELKAEVAKPKAEPKAEPKLTQETQEWLTENAWYNTDPVLRGVADSLSDVIAAENPGLKGRKFLDKLTEKVKVEMPHKFENKRRDAQVTEDHQSKPTKKGRTYDHLPDDARKACDMFVKTIPGFTKEKYLASFDWSDV